MKGTKLYVLILASKGENGDFSDFDVYGLYSSEELAKEVMNSLKREDGRYNGISERYVYEWACITERIIDNNFPDQITMEVGL